MSREARSLRGRAVAVWLVASAASAAAVALSWTPAAAVAGPWSAEVSFADALVRVSALTLVLAVVRLWVVTTITVGQVLWGNAVVPGGGATRRLVLLACGAALAAGVTAPATATEGDRELLAGLSLPDRAVSAARQLDEPRAVSPARTSVEPVHVVQAGDSLWSIAAATSPSGSDLDAAWRALWAANRDVVGNDPDLILPGQRLRLPPAPTTDRTDHPKTDETGDRP